MTEEEIIKKKIMDRLDALPKHKIYCLICRKLCATVSEQRELIHYDCWLEWKRNRPKPQ